MTFKQALSEVERVLLDGAKHRGWLQASPEAHVTRALEAIAPYARGDRDDGHLIQAIARLYMAVARDDVPAPPPGKRRKS